MPRRSTPNLGPAEPPVRTPSLFTRGSVARDPSWDTTVVTLVASEHARRNAANSAAAVAAASTAAVAAAVTPPVAAPVTPPMHAPVTPPQAAAAVAPVAPVAPVTPPANADPFAAMARPAAAAEDPWAQPVAPVSDLVPIEELMADPAWLPEGTSTNVAHQTCGRNPAGHREYPPRFGKPVWVYRIGHASVFKIFIGDLPPGLSLEVFRRDLLTNNPSLVRATTTIDATTGHHWLRDINLRASPESGDTVAFLTFSSEGAAVRCMDVILQWWHPFLEGGWEPLKVKWMVGGN